MNTRRAMNVLSSRLGMVVVLVAALCCAGCLNSGDDGEPVRRVAPGTGGPESIGIESQELMSMTNKMVHSILSHPKFKGRTPAPRIIVDAKYFDNESSSRLNKNLLIDPILTGLLRAANGRLVFIARHRLDAMESERDVDTAYSDKPKERRAAIADYRLTGRIGSQDVINPTTGKHSRYHVFSFRLMDLTNDIFVWADEYKFKKAGKIGSAYR